LDLSDNNLGAEGDAALANAALAESHFSQSVKEVHGDRIKFETFEFSPSLISSAF